MSSIRWQLFPLLYLFTETAGLSAQSWEVLDRQWLRGVLVLPWILIVVPLFLAGLHWQSKPVHAGAARGLWNGLRHARALTTPWFVVLLYIAASAAVSWTAGDTTRWRLSDMPAILTVALGGAMSMRSWSRWRLVGGWIIGLGLLLSAYYLKAEL